MGCNCGGSAKAARERRIERLQKRQAETKPKPDKTIADATYWTGPARSEKSA